MSDRWSVALPVLMLAALLVGGGAWGGIRAPAQQNPGFGPLCQGCTTTEGPVVEVAVESNTCPSGSAQLILEVEVRPLGAEFTQTATHTSAPIDRKPCPSGYLAIPWLRLSNLGAGTFKWQVREVQTSGNVATSWVPFGGGSGAFTVGSSPSLNLAFTSPSRTVAAGACVEAAVESRTATSAPSPVSSATVVTLRSDREVTFHSDPQCAQAISALTLQAGSAQGTFFWRAARAGAVSLAADAPSHLWAEQGHAVVPGPPVALRLVGTAQTLVVGACSAVRTVQVVDAFGNLASLVASATLELSASSPGARFYTQSNCSSPKTSLVLAAGTSSATFHWNGAAIEDPVLTLAAAGLAPASQGQQVRAQAGFSTSAQTLLAGACSGIATVRSQDAAAKAFPLPAATAVELAGKLYCSGSWGGWPTTCSRPPAYTFFSDAACTIPITALTIPGGSSTASFYWRNTVSGSSIISASAVGRLLQGTQTQTVNPGPAVKLGFSTAAQRVTAGACSRVTTVQSQDALGNPSAPQNATQIALGSDSATLSFFSDLACTAPVSALSLSNQATGVSFYWRDSQVGTPTVTGQSSQLGSAAQTHTVLPQGIATRLVIASPSQTVPLGNCSAAVVIRAQDDLGQLAALAAEVEGPLSAASTTLEHFADPYCTSGITGLALPQGGSTASFYFADHTAGSTTVRWSPSGFPALSQSATIGAGGSGAQALTFASPPLSVIAGACAGPVRVQASDAQGLPYNVATNLSFSLTSSSPTLEFFADEACTQPASGGTIEAGTHLAALAVRAASFGTHQLAASAAGLTPASQELIVLPSGGLDLGELCTQDASCALGVCSGGRCCEERCEDPCRACGAAGRCEPLADGTACPDGVFCNGAETCLGGLCAAGIPVSCSDPTFELPLFCDEQATACVPDPSAAPLITRDANPSAGLGLPYRYNHRGAISAFGARPIDFGRCGGPDGLSVDPASGAVHWIPTSLGAVEVCLSALNSEGGDSYRFTVEVSTPNGAHPVAAASVWPQVGPAPLTVSMDASASTADPSTRLVVHAWEAGDFSPLLGGANTGHTYVLPGGYQVVLEVADGFGRTAQAKREVRVLDGDRVPPLARITASAVRGQDALEVELGCDCEPGGAPLVAYRWELAGEAAEGERVRRTLGPGRYRVHLLAVDQAGLTGRDSLELVVSRGFEAPPFCRAFAAPPAGPAPLGLTLRAEYAPGGAPVEGSILSLSDGRSSQQVRWPLTLVGPGRLGARLWVTDAAGLSCFDRAEAVGTSGPLPPPVLLGTALAPARCGVPWSHPAAAAGSIDRWTLQQGPDAPLPAGLTIDGQSGTLSWTPTRGQVGTHRVLRRAEGPGGSAPEQLEVQVHCGEPPRFKVGCAAAPGGPVALLLAWLALGLRRTRCGAAPRRRGRPG